MAVHPVLEAAIKTAGTRFSDWKAVDAGQVAPFLSPRQLVDIGLWLAAQVDAGEPAFSDALSRAREYRDNPQTARDYPYSLGNTRYPNQTLSVALLAEDAALRMTRNPAATRAAVVAAARISVRQLRAGPGDSMDVLSRFLAELDERLIRAECVAAIEPYAGGRSAEVTQVLWRGLHGDCCRHFIVALAGEVGFGLLTKHKSRWRWFEGGLEELLATVPDDLFEDAVRSARPKA